MSAPVIKKEVIPAVIAGTQEELDERVRKVAYVARTVQLDVMDGEFVPNRSLDFDLTLPKTRLRYEAHLMVGDPDGWVAKNLNKVDVILAHIESTKKPLELVRRVREAGKRVGFAVNPETPISHVTDFLGVIDQVLVMTVHPGAYGAQFLPEALSKVRELRRLRVGLDIEVDGGITPATIGAAAAAGANLFVSGSYIMRADDPKAAFKRLEKLITP